ncbi:MAG: hypothetical protein DMF63_02890 [Acidobacteria bacterium]|nr:MAG: hypothetical protein DMF63_02890 [Acidobacteriota bacterium]
MYVVKELPDGKILVGGDFTEVQGYAASGLARLNADGSVDTSFNAPDFFSSLGIGNAVYAIAIQPDGKILVGGQILGAAPDATPGIRRLNADGSIDQSFFITPLTFASTFGGPIVYDIELQSDGKIVIGGVFGGLASGENIGRFNSDGTRDVTFSGMASGVTVKDIAISPDGKIFLGGFIGGLPSVALYKLNSNGSQDPSFSPTESGMGAIEAVRLSPDGKAIVAGTFTAFKGSPQGRISRINTDGSVDLNFNLNGIGANGNIYDIALQPDGKILIAGAFNSFNATARLRIARLTLEGLLDDTFVPTGTITNTTVNDIELMADGRILVGLTSTTLHEPLLRFGSTGTFDPSLVVRINKGGLVRKVVQQPDGKVIAAGEFIYANNVIRRSLVRYNIDGTIDTSFVPFFNSTVSPVNASAIVLQPDGKIVVGFTGSYVLRRLNPDGSEDTSFAITSGAFSVVYDIALLSDGKFIVVGTFGVRRLNSNGTTDSSFTPPQPNGEVFKVAIQPDGKILIGGSFTQIATSIRGGIARLNGTDGSLDNTFNPPGGANNAVQDFELQADGKVVLGGAFTSLNGNSNIKYIGRLNSDGTLDGTFIHAANSPVYAIKLQSGGRVLLGGFFSIIDGVARNGIARLNANGTVDAGFAPFANKNLQDIALQSDGKILIGGAFSKINGVSRPRLARLLDSTTPVRTPFDYDGDGRADVSVFRASTNRWYVLLSGNSTVAEQTFGLAGDVITPADYDGDGKTDIGIFRPSNGQWWYQSSINGAQIANTLGQTGDIPRPSDFDGDGKADLVLFRPSTSTWIRFGSTVGNVPDMAFGLSGDQPVIGDFDGDGKSDLAIFRPSNGDWWYSASSAGGAFRNVHWGQTGDLPAPADFDGDSKTDFAIFRPSDGGWYILNSSNGSFTTTAFGTNGDRPVAADYDGDGRADIAIFRPSTSLWYLLRSTSGFTGLQFGISTDTATPNAFVP